MEQLTTIFLILISLVASFVLILMGLKSINKIMNQLRNGQN